MSQKIIDYTLDRTTPANPDASLPATVANCTVVNGPGATVLGAYPQALDFKAGGTLDVALPAGKPDAVKFCARIVFKPGGPVAARQTLIAATAPPISLDLEPDGGTSEYQLVVRVTTQAHGTGAASTQHLMDLKTADWHVADLVYDTDTVAVFIDGAIVSVHAFPSGSLASAASGALHAGSAPNGTGYPFSGLMAALQLHEDIPLELEGQLDERRAHPQWHLTYKQEELNLDSPLGEFYYDLPSESWIQEFAGTTLMYNETTGMAFEMHGAILAAYRALPFRIELGFLICDEMDGAQGGSRKSLFSRGGIYWSGATGAIPVTGQLWVDYEGMGEGGAIGLPVAPAQTISGGRRQVFQGGEMYWKSGAAKAFEVHGDILARYLSTGGAGTWGFPTTNEADVLDGAAAIGRQSEFEGCTIYWSAGTGAYDVRGDILRKYKEVQGPAGDLGFPTSGQAAISGASGYYNTFQRGSILWFGSYADTLACVPFEITLTRVDTQESEPWYKGENDVFLQASVAEGGHVLHAERLPASGDSDGNNIFDAGPKTFDLGPEGIVPNDPNRSITFRLEIWDSDWPDDDDFLGTFEYVLDMANGWGLRDSPSGVFNSGGFDKINSVAWSVSPKVDLASLTEAQKWWGARNKGTDELTYAQYAAAFSDVDSDTDWWDPRDWLARLFYEAVCKGLADHGNCFGMSLEAIYSKKLRSALKLPIDRFKDAHWEAIRNEFNIKHQYQVGAPAIWWFVGEFLSGKTHDPVSVFKATRALHAAGCDPVLCISQNWDFSGAPHCVLPVAWDDSVSPWRMFIRDPNFPTTGVNDAPRTIEVDPSANTYSYAGSKTYNGGEWSGGRMHYMPWELVNERPRTPVFEAVMLLLSGVILIVGGDSETSALTDENGVDLDAFGADSIDRLKNGKSLANKFVSVKGFDQHRRECSRTNDGPRPDRPPDIRHPRGHGVLTSELYLRSAPKTFSRQPPTGGKRGGDDWRRLTLREYLCLLAPHDIRELFERHPEYVAANNHRLMYRLADTGLVREVMSAALAGTPPGAGGVSKNYIHRLRALRRGRVQYGIKEGLSELLFVTDGAAGDYDTFRVKDLGTHTRTVSVSSSRDKALRVLVSNRLGGGADYLRMDIDGVALVAGKELQINPRPGIGGVELSGRFDLKEQDGLRVVPSTLVASNQLKVSRINALFGAPQSSTLVTASP
jgi:hypothetical protein